MNWERAKIILIIMFLVVDAFLLFVLLQTRSDYEQLPKETVQKTVAILQENGIGIQEKTIPVKRSKNQNVIMRNGFDNPVQVADVFLGTYETMLSNEEKHEFQFENDVATLQIKDTFFTYRSKKNQVSYGASEEPDIKQIKEWLKDLGFKTSEFAVVNGQKTNGKFAGRVIPVYKNLKIYGISMYVEADKEAILTMEGHWFSKAEAEVYEKEQLLDVTAVLTGLIYRKDRWPQTINAIESGFYTSGDYLESREITAVPIYVITDGTGEQKYFDARVGNEIE